MRKLLLACIALLLVAVVVATTMWRELRAERELTATLRQAPVESPAAIQPSATPQPPAKDTQPAAGAPQAKPGSPIVLYDERELLRDPEYRSAEFRQVRGRIPRDYPGLAEELGLTEEQAGRLFDLLTEVQLQKRAASVPVVLGQAPDQAAMERMVEARQAIQRQRDESIAAMLGTATLDGFRRFEEERGARARVEQLGRTLAAAGYPLTAAQQRPLVEAWLAEDKRERAHLQAGAPVPVPGQALDVQQMLAEAARIDEQDLERQAERNQRLLQSVQPHLDASQLETLRGQLEQALAQERAAFRIQRDQGVASKP